MARTKRGNFNVFGHYTRCVPGVADLFILLALLLLGALAGNAVSLVFAAVLGQSAGMEYGMLVSYPLMFIFAMMWASGRSRRNAMTGYGSLLDNDHFTPLGGFSAALLAMVATFAAGFCCDAVNSLLPAMPKWLEDILKGMTSGKFWINFLCVSIFAPFFEEWLCRGMVLRGLLGHGTKPWLAISVSALFFAVIHMNPWQAIPAFMLGLLFGYVYYKTGSLKLTILMHFTNNTIALCLGHIESLKDVESWMDVLGQWYWPGFFASAIILVLTVRAFRRIETPEKGNFDIVPPLFSE